VRASALVKVSLRNLAVCFSAGTALAALSEACTAERPSPTPSTTEPQAVKPAPIADASPRLDALRRRFPAVFGAAAAPHVRFERALDGGLVARVTADDKAATVELPAHADGPARVTDDASKKSARFSLVGAASVDAAVAGDVAIYAGAAPSGGDVVHRVSAAGTEDFVVFDAAPAREELRYHLDAGGFAGLRLVAGTLELLDAGGVPLLRVAPPYVVDAGGARREAALSVEGCAFDESPRAPFGRPVTPPGAPSCTVKVAWAGAAVRYPAIVDPVWSSTLNAMATARTRHTMTLLSPTDPKSMALIAGGFATGGGVALKGAELYDPLSRRFTVTGSMSVARGAHSATLLTTIVQPQFGPAQPVLVAGGADSSNTPLASLEVYDPATGVFVTDGNTMSAAPRFDHTGTLFADQTVLLAGGTSLPLNQPTNSAYVYTFTGLVGSPPTGVTSALALLPALMSTSRSAHTATLLGSGKVLVAGGFVLAGGALQALQNGELFDPTNNSFALVATAGGGLANMSVQRGFHSATLLASGRVFIAGGLSKTPGGIYTNTADFYSDGQGGVTGFVAQAVPVTMAVGRANHTATRLTNGDVLVAGGFNGGGSAASNVEIFSIASQSFSALTTPAPMLARGDHAALLINAGDSVAAGKTVLVTGGANAASVGAQTTANAQILLRVNGDACAQDDQCLSGHCADAAPGAGKMCCDTACNETCRACSAAGKGSGVDGVCDNASATTVLGWTCVPTLGQEVEILQGCDGHGHVIPFATNKCVPNNCNGSRCATDCPCSDAGFCTDAGVEAGPDAGGTGGGGAGGSGSGGGAPDAGPSSGLHCENRKQNSLSCTLGRECNSGFCVDGYCCNVACTQQCEACDVPGKYGFCYPVGGPGGGEAPHVDGGSVDFGGNLTPRMSCAGGGTGCLGSCQGDPMKCTYPGSTVVSKPPVCNVVDGGAVTTDYSCNGAGAEIGVPTSCAGFECQDEGDAGPGDAGVSCKTTCAGDPDCIQDFICGHDGGAPGACVHLDGPLCDGDHTLRQPAAAGGNKSCDGNYACPAGATKCLDKCEAVQDCVGGYICDHTKKCVPMAAVPLLPGCAVGGAPAGGRAAGGWGAALLGLLVLAARRRPPGLRPHGRLPSEVRRPPSAARRRRR
jgi:hypothetical protein